MYADPLYDFYGWLILASFAIPILIAAFLGLVVFFFSFLAVFGVIGGTSTPGEKTELMTDAEAEFWNESSRR
jgi:uncharacterized transporter YbjL